MPKGMVGFQKGNQINKGRENLTRDDREARKMNAVEFTRIANKYLHTPIQDLEKLAHDRSLPAIECIVVRILMMAGNKADQNRIEWVLTRVMGKVPDVIIDKTNEHEKEKLAEELLAIARKPE